LQTLKIPNNLHCSIHLQKAYLAYLWFKKNAVNGRLDATFRGDSRFTDGYWAKKLIGLGWIVLDGNEYQLRSYQFIWRQIGVNKVNRPSKKRLVFRYIKLDPKVLSLPRKKFHTHILKVIRETAVETKKIQLAFRLLPRTFSSKTQQRRYIKAIRAHQQPEFSSVASKKLFGYKSESSGWRLVRQYFKVTNIPKTRMKLTEKNLPYFRTDSLRISLV